MINVTEPKLPKQGTGGLKMLQIVSNLIGDEIIAVKSNTGGSIKHRLIFQLFDADPSIIILLDPWIIKAYESLRSIDH